MLKTVRNNHIISNLLMVGMIALLAVCVFTPNIVILKKISSHAVQLMVLYLGAGLFFHIFDRKRLLFTAFACSAALCIYFKLSSDITIAPPVKTEQPTFLLSHTSTGNLLADPGTSLHSLINQKADIVSILEITPNWEDILEQTLAEHYPYHATITRIDDFGCALFSKFPLVRVDTVYYDDLPNLFATIALDDDHAINVFSSNTNPPLFRRSFEQLRAQLDVIANCVLETTGPTITAGNYHLDQFSDEIQDFRVKANLKDSRKSMSPSLYPPTSHIFYNNDLECLTFSNWYNDVAERVGIIGEFQFKKLDDSAATGME
ncbi:MAG: endonuclease/exonuclease/phosphatase family protein [Saprospiraceae bacterium]|nr:endonuclease/exonuclease/phosphatase family protein [Saprospiraceae bacterium]